MIDEVFIFPYEKVPYGSRIILYGFGHVGMSYRIQVTTIRYCEVVGFSASEIDMEKLEGIKYRLINREDLKKVMEEEKIDFIVIALNSVSIANRIQKELIEIYSIDPQQIVYADKRKIPIQVMNKSLEHFWSSYDNTQNCLKAFICRKNGNMEYFSEMVSEIKALDREEQQKFYDYMVSYVKMEPLYVKRVIALRILYNAELFDSACMELYFDAAEDPEISNDAKMWLLHDISVMERNHQDYRNENYYLRKRKLMCECMHKYVEDTEQVQKKYGCSKKVAIITFGLGGARSSHNALIVPYANEICRQGKEVVIFPVNLFRYRYGESFLIPIEAIESDSIKCEGYHKSAFNEKIKIVYAYGETMRQRTEFFWHSLLEYDPDVVIDFCGEYAYYSPLYQKRFLTLAIPMRGYASSGCCDIYLSRSKELCILENERFQSLKEGQIYESLITSTPQVAINHYFRKDYNINESAFVIVTVGGRLKTELTKEFIKVVCHFLNKYEDAIWILVGEKVGDVIREEYEELLERKKIICWGYEKDLPGMYELCDVYWNPDRMGAGGSIGTAMRCGLPIVTTRFPSDMLPRLGIENAVDGNYEKCEEYVEQLFLDKELYKEKSQLMKERMSISSVEQYICRLFEIADQYKPEQQSE